jgi:NitT/TauT family transport system permease protein
MPATAVTGLMPRTPRRTGGSSVGARLALGAAGITLCLLAGQGLSLVIPVTLLPRASTVLAAMIRLAGTAGFRAAAAATVQAWAAGLGLTVLIAVPAGVILGAVPGLRDAVRAVLEFARPVPPVALIGLASLLLGSGLPMMTVLIVYGCCWPVLYTTIAGIDATDPVAAGTLRAFGFRRLAVARLVALPSAAPFIAVGIRIASAIALVADIGAGYVTGSSGGPGIGAFIAAASAGPGSLPVILAATAWTGVLGVALDGLLGQLEQRLLPWHHARLAAERDR